MTAFKGFVPDYILRNYLVRGKTATILSGAKVRIHRIQEPVLIEGNPREFHEVVCRQCGAVAKVRFKPDGFYAEDSRGGIRTTYGPCEDENGEIYDYEVSEPLVVTVFNLLPGYDEVYTRKSHNARVVWMQDGEYHSSDINSTAEVRDGKD